MIPIQPPPEKAKALTPVNSDEEDRFMTEDQKRQQASALRRSKASMRGLPTPSNPEGAGDPSQGKSGMTTRSKAKGGIGLEKPKRVPEECVAGGTRVVAGSGQTGTRAANCRPPKT
jgi:hypothetical protein